MAVSSPPLAPATMFQDFVSSDDAPHQHPQSYGDCSNVQQYPSHNGTIDPSLLMYGNRGPFSQHDSSPIPPSIPRDGRPHPALALSTSKEVWMGHPGEGVSASALSPISPTMSNGVSALTC